MGDKPTKKVQVKVRWISDKPLYCSYKGPLKKAYPRVGHCSIQNAPKVYRAVNDRFNKMCPKDKSSNPLMPTLIRYKRWASYLPSHIGFKYWWQTYITCQNHLVSFFHAWKASELDKATHPLAKLAFYFDSNQLEDLRSMRAFELAADDPGLIKHIERSKNKERTFTMVYPGAGSHIAPLVTVFKLLEKKRRDGSELLRTAKIVYSDINAARFKRMMIYLKFMQKKGLISNFRNTGEISVEEPGGAWRIIDYSFKYKGKTVKFTYDLNAWHELWANEADISEADLIVDHDGFREKVMRTMLFYLSWISQTKHKLHLVRPKKRFYLTANFSGTRQYLRSRGFRTKRVINQAYGCGPSAQNISLPRYISIQSGNNWVVQKKLLPNDPFNRKKLNYLYHYGPYHYDSALMVEIPLNHVWHYAPRVMRVPDRKAPTFTESKGSYW